MFHELKLRDNTVETTKNICCTKEESTVHQSYQVVQKFFLGCKNLNNQAMSGRPKTEGFKAILEAIKVIQGVELWDY